MFRRKVYLTAHKIVGNHLDADEVVQETFVRVYRRRKQLGRVKYFSTFLMRVATNYAIDLLRRRKVYRDLDDYAGKLPVSVQLDLSKRVATPGDDFENKRLREEIQYALEQLPPRQKLTAILHDVDGHTKAEIAAILECPEATVRSNLHIARTKLKRILKHRL
jgi:RNA polymerase sigma-70 factor (ECF subfamily)